jgi:glycosyltransferase involved in cell wall biosynthesis
LLYVARNATKNPFKDFRTVREAAGRVAREVEPAPVLLFVLGEERPAEHEDNLEIRFALVRSELSKVADFYRAADIYLHAAAAENFPTTVLEAMACERPVVATGVGGICEQVVSLGDRTSTRWTVSGPDNATGVLVDPQDSGAMAHWILWLLRDPGLRARLGANARARAVAEFDQNVMAKRYLEWYEEILKDWKVK